MSLTSCLVATPSYAMRIAEVAKEIGLDPKKDLKRYPCCLAELDDRGHATELCWAGLGLRRT